MQEFFEKKPILDEFIDMKFLKDLRTEIVHGDENSGVRKYVEKEGLEIEGVQKPMPVFTEVWIK